MRRAKAVCTRSSCPREFRPGLGEQIRLSCDPWRKQELGGHSDTTPRLLVSVLGRQELCVPAAPRSLRRDPSWVCSFERRSHCCAGLPNGRQWDMATAAWGWDPGPFLGLETGTCRNRGTQGPFPLGVQEDTRPRGWGWAPPWTRGPGLQTSTLPLRSAGTSGSPGRPSGSSQDHPPRSLLPARSCLEVVVLHVESLHFHSSPLSQPPGVAMGTRLWYPQHP